MRIFSAATHWLMLFFVFRIFAAEDNLQHAHFQEVDTLFANPGQGWMSHQRDSLRLPVSVNYLRFDWARAEPEAGRFDWQFIDDALAAGKSNDVAIAMRVITANAHSENYYSSPKWLFDLGCKGFEYTVGGDDPTSGGKRITRIEPDYADPIYLAEQEKFIAALGRRYDGNPHVEFLDIGSYGIWGEWHTQHPASAAVRRQIVDIYLQAFPKTPLVFMSDDAEVMGYALAHGTGFRRDGVGSPWHEQNWIGSKRYAGVSGMAETWKHAPVVFEWFGSYSYLKSKNWSFDAAVNFMLSNHVTLINDTLGEYPPAARPQVEKLARLAGYRFVLREVTHEKTAVRGATLPVTMTWANVGVGKLYRAYQLQLALEDSSGHFSCFFPSDADPRDWLPGERIVAAALPIPATVPPGEYTLMLALTVPTGSRRPLQLAMDAPAQQGWYQVSRLKVK